MDKRYKGKKRIKPNKKKPKAKMPGKNYEGHDPLVSSDTTMETVSKPVDKDNWNRADMSLARMTQNKGVSRQKVRIK